MDVEGIRGALYIPAELDLVLAKETQSVFINLVVQQFRILRHEHGFALERIAAQ